MSLVIDSSVIEPQMLNYAINGLNTSQMILCDNNSSDSLSNLGVNTCNTIFNNISDESMIFKSPMSSKFTSFMYGPSNISITTPTKRFFETNGDISTNLKKTKIDYNITCHEDTSKHLLSIIDRLYSLEMNVAALKTENEELVRKNLIMYNNLGLLNIDKSNLEKEITNVSLQYKALLEKSDTLKLNDCVMVDSSVIQTPKLYADLFKISNNKMSEPLQEIMKVVTNNEEEKKKRENNLIVFGLEVNRNDKNFTNVKKLFNDIGLNANLVDRAYYLNSKNDQTPIKLIAYDSHSRNTILKAAKKLKQLNFTNKSKISIVQDLSYVDRQIHKDLVNKRNILNLNLKENDDHYFGIRNNNIARISKIKS